MSRANRCDVITRAPPALPLLVKRAIELSSGDVDDQPPAAGTCRHATHRAVSGAMAILMFNDKADFATRRRDKKLAR
jgi:hypothetical protein